MRTAPYVIIDLLLVPTVRMLWVACSGLFRAKQLFQL